MSFVFTDVVLGVLELIQLRLEKLAVKLPTGFGSFSKIINDPHRASDLTAGTPHFMLLLIIIF